MRVLLPRPPPRSISRSASSMAGACSGCASATGSRLVGVERLELERSPTCAFRSTSRAAGALPEPSLPVTGAELHIEEAQLAAWLTGRSSLGRFGVGGPRVRSSGPHRARRARARRRARDRGHRAARARTRHGGAAGHLHLTDVRTYGFLPAPAPLLGLGLVARARRQRGGRGGRAARDRRPARPTAGRPCCSTGSIGWS